MSSVLIVDEDVGVRDAIGACLDDIGWRPSAAATPEHGLQLLTHIRPDAAIVDVAWLPPSRSRLLLTYRAVELGIPVLIMTGSSSVQEHLQALGCPCLAKPFRLEGLRTELHALLHDMARHRAHMRQLHEHLSANVEELRQRLMQAQEILAAAKADHHSRRR